MKIPLTKYEQADVLYLNSITRVFFFDGHHEGVYNEVRQRLIRLMRQNIWLSSSLKHEHNEVLLDFDEHIDIEEVIDRFLVSDIDLCIDDSMSYSRMHRKIKKHFVPPPKKLLKTGDPILKITLLSHQLNNTPGLAMIFSFSHIGGDGYTFYKLVNGFFDHSQLVSLNYQRYKGTDDAIHDLFGSASHKFFSPLRMAIEIALDSGYWKKRAIACHYLNEEKIAELKAIYANDPDSKFPYISTNDILTSLFCNISESRVSFIAVNLRGRVDGLGKDDAGNYQYALLIDKEHYQTPEAIRELMLDKTKYKEGMRQNPGLWELTQSNISNMTNPSAFVQEYKLCGLKQILHLPMKHPKYVYFEYANIVKAKNDRLAFFYMGKQAHLKELQNSGILAESVCDSLF